QMLTGTGSRVAGRAGGSASNVMARRAARAEMESNLTVDPTVQRNRLLSGLTVVLLAVLVGVVLWATNPNQTIGSRLAASVANVNFFSSTEQPATSVPLLATSVPTVTPLPSILEARGSVAYTVRE